MSRAGTEALGRGKTAGRAGKPNPFVQYELTEAQIQDARKKRAETGVTLEDLDKLCEARYKITFGWDTYSECPTCWLLPQDPEDANYGMILAGRGKDCHNALFEALYKHFNVFKGNWPHRTANSPKETWDK